MGKSMFRAFVLLVTLYLLVTFSIPFATSQELDSPSIKGANEEDEFVRNSQEALKQDAQWYAEYFGVSFEEALRRLQLQGLIGELNAMLTEQESDSFAGLWIQNVPDYRVFIAFTENGEEKVQPYIKDQAYEELIEVKVADISLASLQEDQRKIFSDVGSLGIDLISGIDVANNRITLEVLSVDQLAPALQQAGILLPSYVQVIEVDELPTPEANDFAGLPQSHGTSGYIVYEASTGAKYHSTAGHLSNNINLYPGSPIETHLPYKVGSERYGGNYDYQLHLIPANLTPQPWAADATPDSTPYYRIITARASRIQQSPGSTACHYGSNTGYSCGTIQSNNQCVVINGIQGCEWVRVTGANHGGGDSGGPWYFGGTAYGIHSSGGGGTTIYMPVDSMFDHGYLVWTQ